jgi:hypothetical protein
MTTEATLLMTFRDRISGFAGQEGRNNPELQQAVKAAGADIVKALQQNHGHSLADAVALLRMVLNGLNIK